MADTKSEFLVQGACRITRDLVARNPVKPDLFRDYEALQVWPLATALYSGIEQALKRLLLTPPNPRFELEELAKDYGHDLAKLYNELEVDDRQHIELHFREHWSLYDYKLPKGVVIGTAEDFIVRINGGRPSRGLSWRYFLLDESVEIPSTSLWTMSEIWDAICCCIRRASGSQDCSRLRQRLSFEFSQRITGRAVPYDGALGDLNSWIALNNGDQVAAWIDLLVKASRDTIHDVQVPDWFRSELADMARQAIDQLSESTDPDEVQLLQRIQHTEQTLVWDPGNAEFHWTPSN